MDNDILLLKDFVAAGYHVVPEDVKFAIKCHSTTKVVRYLIDQCGAYVVVDEDNYYHACVRYNNMHILSLLKKLNHDVNAKNATGDTPFVLAVRLCKESHIYWLLDNKSSLGLMIDPSLKCHNALTRVKSADLIVLLLRHGILNVDGYEDGSTLLYKVVKNEWKEGVYSLLELGANVNLLTEKGKSVLYRSIEWQDKDIVDALLLHNAEIDIEILQRVIRLSNNATFLQLFNLRKWSAEEITQCAEKAYEHVRFNIYRYLLGNGAQIKFSSLDSHAINYRYKYIPDISDKWIINQTRLRQTMLDEFFIHKFLTTNCHIIVDTKKLTFREYVGVLRSSECDYSVSYSEGIEIESVAIGSAKFLQNKAFLSSCVWLAKCINATSEDLIMMHRHFKYGDFNFKCFSELHYISTAFYNYFNVNSTLSREGIPELSLPYELLDKIFGYVLDISEVWVRGMRGA